MGWMHERGGASPARGRRRLSRTLARARWPEYSAFLDAAVLRGYSITSLDAWVSAGRPADGNILILRHDVDQHPASALRMAGIEQSRGLSSTWYFRWRTADPRVIDELRRQGFSIGLHYETLTRLARERGLTKQAEADQLLAEARGVLRGEISSFARRYGPIRSACPHGDSRVSGITNAVLLRDCDWRSYGLDFDGNEVMRGTRLGLWLTDRSTPDGGWDNQAKPGELFAEHLSPILALTHPNNWASGPSLWVDRALSGLLPSALPRPVRTRSDQPPDV